MGTLHTGALVISGDAVRAQPKTQSLVGFVVAQESFTSEGV